MVRHNRRSFYALLLLASLLLVSCSYNGRSMDKAGNNVVFDTISLISRNYLEEDTTNPYCDLRIEFVYPVSSHKTNLDTLQQFFVRSMFGTSYDSLRPAAAVETYRKNYIDNYRSDAKTYSEIVRDMHELNERIPYMDLTDNEQTTEELFYSYFEDLSNSIVYNQHELLSFQVKQSNNKGGATSYTSLRNYVFSLNRGAQVNENEIFNAGYDTALQGLIVASLLEQNGVKTVDELEDLGFFGIQEIVPNKNFLLKREGIIYTFNKGEYSAYQLDAPEVFIPYKAIRYLLRENSIAAKLADLK